MSIFVTAHAKCPACDTPATLDYPASVNADRRPDLRASILDQSLFTLPCPSCGATLTFEPHITYLDMKRGQWILAESTDEIEHWRDAEAAATGIYDTAFGAGAPDVARALGARLKPRLVFGWPALIEKLRCDELGLDDVALESLKLAMLRATPERSIDPGQELRLSGRDGSNLVFAWIDPTTGAEMARVVAPDAAYVVVKGDAAAWAPLARLLAGQMYVDMNRVLRDAAPAAAG